MREADEPEITLLLRQWSDGDQAALAELMSAVYDDLHQLGRSSLAARPSPTLQPTAVVHEAFLQLLEQKRVVWQSRGHFFGVMALLMRRALQRHGERKSAAKRDGGAVLPLDAVPEPPAPEPAELAQLADALADLARLDARQGRIVELRFFAGCDTEQIARELGVSTATVKREWRLARAWLRRRLASPHRSPGLPGNGLAGNVNGPRNPA